jgi:enamine deaminase RidA (YjgF/YER057c/UK114 family)
MRSMLALLVLTSFAAPAAAQATREHFAPPGMEASYQQWHYSPAVRVGDMVIVSRIPASIGTDYEGRVRHMSEALEAHLAAAGAGLGDVVEITTCHAGPRDSAAFQAEFERFAPVHHECFRAHYPAWSAVAVSALLQPGAAVESRAVAIIGSGRAPKAEIPLPPTRPPSQP